MSATGPVHTDGPDLGGAHGHTAWVGSGRDGDDGLVDTALRVFAAAGPTEKLVLVADVDTRAVVERHAGDLASGRLVIISALEAYAPVLAGGDGACAAQLAVFDGVVEEALAAGWTGLRVVADNTPMLAGTDEQAANWLRWEQLTDRWQLHRPIHGNCWFDASALSPGRLAAALSRHPATVGAEPSWRLNYEQDDTGTMRLALAGALEAFDAPELGRALATSVGLADSGARLELSLRDVTFLHHNVVISLAAAGADPPGLRITGATPAVRRLLDVVPSLPGLDVG